MRTPLIAFGLYIFGAALGAGWAVTSAGRDRAPEQEPPPLREVAPAPAASENARLEPAMRALFLGNGILLENDLVGTIDRLAVAGGLAPLEATVDGPGGFTLAQHVAAGRYQAHLAGRRFDFVLLQEQSQHTAFGAKQRARTTEPAVRRLVGAARAAGSQPVFFTTWARLGGDPANHPGDTFDGMQERVIATYRQLAAEHHALRIPVGDVWRRVRHERPELDLWKADGSHPTALGSYLAACTCYATLYERSVSGNAYTAGVPPDIAAYVQAAVDATLALATSPSAVGAGPIPGIVPQRAGDCPDAYEPVEDVCMHRALGVPPAERLRLIISYKAGLATPTLER